MNAREYEQLVADIYAQLAEDHAANVFQDRRFRGKSGQDHQIDVAVELSILGDVRILILIECKWWNRCVGLEEVAVLIGRVQDIGAHKAILVTKTGFQAGAYRLARASGIALVLCQGKGPLKVQLRRETSGQPAEPGDVLRSWFAASYSYRVLGDEGVQRLTTFPLLVSELSAEIGGAHGSPQDEEPCPS